MVPQHRVLNIPLVLMSYLIKLTALACHTHTVRLFDSPVQLQTVPPPIRINYLFYAAVVICTFCFLSVYFLTLRVAVMSSKCFLILDSFLHAPLVFYWWSIMSAFSAAVFANYGSTFYRNQLTRFRNLELVICIYVTCTGYFRFFTILHARPHMCLRYYGRTEKLKHE